MIKIDYFVRAFIKNDEKCQVAIRVRWNDKRNETTFITGMRADPDKWDKDGQKAMRRTVHVVKRQKFTAEEINERINDFKQEIEAAFDSFAVQNRIPSVSELRDMFNEGIGRKEFEIAQQTLIKKKPITELLADFLSECGAEKNWNDIAKEKYTQAVNHLIKAVPGLKVENITLDTMLKLRKWYSDNEFRNRTVSKQLTMLKAFLRWVNDQKGYSIPEKVLTFSPHLKVARKTVTFLNYEELMQLINAPLEKEHIQLARDLWCFMALTSLRYSDLANLKVGHINENRIEMLTQKTSDRITIPLTELAISIYERYKDHPTKDGHIFPVPSNQKLNDYIKIAAKEAGIDRMIVDTFFVGTERKEEQHPFHEIISCHDARRTFVSCSLAMGIPPHVVMKATGHKGYKTMQPYIDTATETQSLEMEKWNKNQHRSQIISMLDNLTTEQLQKTLAALKEIAS